MTFMIFEANKKKVKGNIFYFLMMKARVKSLLSTQVIFSILFLLSFYNIVISQTRTDTIGRTTFDLQFVGPACKVAVELNDYEIWGIYTTWLHSLDTIPFSDLQMYYNCFDYSIWRWGDFGISGYLNLWRNNIANLDVTYDDNAAYAAYKNNVYLLEDAWPASGYFCVLSIVPDTNYQYPILSIGSGHYGDNYHIAAFNNDSIYYTFSRYGSVWANWRSIGYAGYPSHNICASKNSGKVCVLWTVVDSTRPDWGVLYLRTSQDSGQTWSAPTPISNDIPSNLRNTFLGGYAIYDNYDNLHIVTQTYDGHHVKPVELWHYSSANNPSWSRIAYLTTDTLLGKLGYGAIYACRPNIIQCNDGYSQRFFVVWEQFQWGDVDSSTDEKYLRADIYGAISDNFGGQWSDSMSLTNSIGINERSPNLVYVTGHLRPHIAITYMIDNSAGIYVKGEGNITINPIICKALRLYDDIEENSFSSLNSSLRISPNPFSKSVSITFNPFVKGKVSVDIYDREGRLIKALKENSNSERNIILWDGKDTFGKIVSKGIYFCVVKTENIYITKKLVFVK